MMQNQKNHRKGKHKKRKSSRWRSDIQKCGSDFARSPRGRLQPCKIHSFRWREKCDFKDCLGHHQQAFEARSKTAFAEWQIRPGLVQVKKAFQKLAANLLSQSEEEARTKIST